MKFLFTEKVPYLLTMLFALAGYQLNHIVDSFLERPVLAYEYKTLSETDSADVRSEQLSLNLHNLNTKLAFKNLRFDVKYRNIKEKRDGIEKFYNADLIPIAPAPLIPDTGLIVLDKLIRFDIPQIQPNGEYLLQFTVKHSIDNNIHPKIYLQSLDSVLLEEAGFEVFIVQNQLLINLSILLIWLIFIVVYIYQISKNPAT